MVNQCIKNAISRVENQGNRWNAYKYIDYFCKRNHLTMEESVQIRNEVSKYIDENIDRLFPINFTINEVAC